MAATETPLYSGRVVDNGLQTAVQELRHPDGRVITIVGCVHVAEPEYFQRIRETVDKLESNGATVYMEGVREATNGAIRSEMPEEARKAVDNQIAAMKAQYIELSKLFEVPWIYQEADESALYPYPDTWRPSDCNQLDSFYLLGPDGMTEVAPLAKSFDRYKECKAKNPYGVQFTFEREKFWRKYIEVFRVRGFAYRQWAKLINGIRRLARLLTRKPLPKGNVSIDPFVYTYRESIAAITALKDGGDVVLLWHPLHAIGLGRTFRRHGFVPQEPVWLQATHAVPILTKPKEPKKPRKVKTRGGDATP